MLNCDPAMYFYTQYYAHIEDTPMATENLKSERLSLNGEKVGKKGMRLHKQTVSRYG